MKSAFYDSPDYKKKQSTLIKSAWENGAYSHLKKIEKRICARDECDISFLSVPSDPKKYCSRSCAIKVNNTQRKRNLKLDKKQLTELYRHGLSSKEIAKKLGISINKINYWLKQFKIPKRSISEAVYLKYNPNGDPFQIKKNLTLEEVELLGLGLGLYRGEGSKKGTHDVRLSNSDPKLIKKFLDFLIKICQINTDKLKFWLQIFDDTNPKKALKFWCQELNVKPEKFYRTTINPSRGPGTYKEKCRFGVLTVRFGNTKLRKELLSMLKNYAREAQVVERSFGKAEDGGASPPTGSN